MAMNVNSKLICVGLGLMMCLQNYSFFLGYWDQYSKISQSQDCAGVSWWLGYEAVVCAIESVFALGMMLGAVWDGSKLLWWFFFLLHLVDAVPGYTLATIFLGKHIYSEEGQACAAADPMVGDATKAVWLSQACFGYAFYVCFMLGQLYMVVVKKGDEQGPFLSEIDQDKVVIFVLGVMMMVQNFAFGHSYWTLFTEIGLDSECAGTRWWLGYDAIVCVFETTFAGCMMFSGWIDGSKVLFWIFWVLHAIDAVPGYTGACIYLGKSLKSDDGLACATKYPSVGRRSNEVWTVQLAFYFFYVGCMLAITYTAAIKQKAKPGGFQSLE